MAKMPHSLVNTPCAQVPGATGQCGSWRLLIERQSFSFLGPGAEPEGHSKGPRMGLRGLQDSGIAQPLWSPLRPTPVNNEGAQRHEPLFMHRAVAAGHSLPVN